MGLFFNALTTSICATMLVFLPSCDKKPHSATPPSAPRAAYPPQPLKYHERVTQGAFADEKLPLIIGLHGMGDRPQRYMTEFDSLPFKARIIVPEAPIQWSNGYTWYDVTYPFNFDPNSHTEKIAQAADSVADLISNLVKSKPTSGLPMLVGYSQGAMITYAVAIRHPKSIALAVPINGALPEGMWLSGKYGASMPVVRAFHGADDEVVPTSQDKRTNQYLRNRGMTATLKGYPDVSHAYPPEMQRDVFKTLSQYVTTPPKQQILRKQPSR